MWVQKGKAVDSSMFSDAIFRVKSKVYFGASIGVQDFRQLKVSMVREFIPPSLHIDGGDTIADLSSDHSRSIARSRYGLVEHDLPLLTEDAIWEYRSYNQQWFNFCGIGSQPPQQPLRIRHQAELVPYSLPPNPSTTTTGFSESSLAAIIEKSVANALEIALEKALPRAIRRLEREICDDFLPTIVQSAIDARLAIREPKEPSISVKKASASRDIISVSSERDVISISSGDSFIDDAGLEDQNYVESESDDDDDLISGGRDRGGNGGVGNRSGRYGSTRGDEHVGQSRISKAGKGDPLPNNGDHLAILSSIHEFELDLAAESSLPPTPLPLKESLDARALEGIRRALNDPNAVAKSPEQLDLVSTAIEGTSDGVFIIGTGGGKSMAWDGPPHMEPGYASVVMVPYASLLEQHLQTSLSRGIVAAKYTVGSEPPDDFQVLYIQPETGKTTAFRQ
jgi:hypothetical protein